MPLYPPPSSPTAPPVNVNMWTILSGRPNPMGVSTGSLAKDVWRFAPCWTPAPISIKALSVETTVAAAGGTAGLIFGIYSVGTDGRPATLLADLSAAGAIDLTAAPGVLTVTGLSLVIPAGECFIGCAWSGTATTPPTVRTMSDTHPRVVDAAAGATGRNGYLTGVSGASAPASVTVSTTATTAIAHFGQMA